MTTTLSRPWAPAPFKSERGLPGLGAKKKEPTIFSNLLTAGGIVLPPVIINAAIEGAWPGTNPVYALMGSLAVSIGIGYFAKSLTIGIGGSFQSVILYYFRTEMAPSK